MVRLNNQVKSNTEENKQTVVFSSAHDQKEMQNNNTNNKDATDATFLDEEYDSF